MNAADIAATHQPPKPHHPPSLTKPNVLITATLLFVGIVALSLAFAPVNQFYLAWIGLAPFFLATRDLRTVHAAFLWGWGAGIVYFLANMWWLKMVTPAGAVALAVYLGLFWGIAGALVRGCALLGRWELVRRRALPPRRPLRCALLLAAMWSGLEWLRGAYSPCGAHGLPWLFLGYSQTPFLASCQIADITGVCGVSFWVVLVNALVAMLWIDRAKLMRLRTTALSVTGIMIALAGYGLFRMRQQSTRPGPTVLVMQSNYPQSRNGEKGAPMETIAAYHLQKTDAALAACERRGQKVDLVAWSETMMPPLNQAALTYNKGTDYGNFIERTSQAISGLAIRHRTSLLVGSTFGDHWQVVIRSNGQSSPAPLDRRNSAYLFGPTGVISLERYDKIKLLPFGEFVPFRDTIPWLYRMLLSLGPPDLKGYELKPGAPDALTVFHLGRVKPTELAGRGPVLETQTWRFVVAICFEDIVAPLVDDLLWGAQGKRADFIVNITNDGWFRGSEKAQHLQAAIFRSIEHRVSTARSVNTGISGFIDSTGRVSDTILSGTDGWSVKQLQVDDRTTLYSRWGDAFARLCAGVNGGILGYGLLTAIQNRRRKTSASTELPN